MSAKIQQWEVTKRPDLDVQARGVWDGIPAVPLTQGEKMGEMQAFLLRGRDAIQRAQGLETIYVVRAASSKDGEPLLFAPVISLNAGPHEQDLAIRNPSQITIDIIRAALREYLK